MSDTPAISIRGVSKKYRLYNSPVERLKEALHPFRKQYHREFWALQNISFDVPVGATLGIIGRNGSGKSTLLQIICSILRPTNGEVDVCGRISALLELGAGFNPQFTGRDNAIFTGQLMGFSRAEIAARMPEIEAFADIGEFIDQPVKTYSSGMFVRLAFACAIHVDPDILVVDEALAVGDVTFQEKCFRKFRQFQEIGKTIVFVTHDDQAVAKFCTQAMLLDHGQLVCHDVPTRTIRRYYDILSGRSARPVPLPEGKSVLLTEGSPASRDADDALAEFLTSHPDSDICLHRAGYNAECHPQKSEQAELIDYFVVAGDVANSTVVDPDSRVDIYYKVRFYADMPRVFFGLALKTMDGVTVYALNSAWLDIVHPSTCAGDILIAKFSLPMRLHAGTYFIDAGVDALWTPDAPSAPTDAGTDHPYYPIDRRLSLFYLTVWQRREFHGLADLQATFEWMPASDAGTAEKDS